MKINEVKCNNIVFGGDDLPFIGGHCVIENRDHVLKMAESILSVTEKLGIPFIFKASFDKANRTSIDSFRGNGLDEGLKILQEVKDTFQISITTDIHHPEHAKSVGNVADILQIPAFLCRQTDLLIAAGETGKVVNVKKGQFLAPWDMKNVITKLEESSCVDILLTDRGTQFGYNNLVADMRSIPLMQELGYPIIFDATHSAQLPGGGGKITSGMRDMIPTLAKAAVAAGCNGIFMEVHDNIEKAISDSATQWPLNDLLSLLLDLKSIKESLH